MATVTAGPLSADAVGYIDENVGINPPPSADGVSYLDENVGFQITSGSPDGVSYLDENIGLALGALIPDAVAYLDLGDVNTDVPTPHLWFFIPGVARPGDPVLAYCQGAGTDMSKVVVERFVDGPSGGWQQIPVMALKNLPASADAYTDARFIDATTGANVEHCEIQIFVPIDVVPDHLTLRVRTIA